MLKMLEDTFLLLDSLEEDQEYIKELKPKICLEIGYNLSFFYLFSIKFNIKLIYFNIPGLVQDV